MKQNLHTHTLYCDGKSTIKDMIRSALLRDFDVLGFSGHSFTAFDESYCMSRDGLLDYLDDLTDAREMFEKDQEAAKKFFAPEMVGAKDLRILIGLEQDLYSAEPALRKQQGILNSGSQYGTFDYIIGSTHAIRLSLEELKERAWDMSEFKAPDMDGVVLSDDGLYIYVDYGPEALNWAIDKIFGGDPLAFAEAYFRDESRIVAETDCDIVGHFDLLLKFNEKDKMFDETSLRYVQARDKALDRIFSDFKAKGMRPIFEVNTGAMARGYRTVPYPSQDSLKAIRDRGGQIIINSDCHRADLLDFGFSYARELVLGAGFEETTADSLVIYI